MSRFSRTARVPYIQHCIAGVQDRRHRGSPDTLIGTPMFRRILRDTGPPSPIIWYIHIGLYIVGSAVNEVKNEEVPFSNFA